jgi:hypothetical protein
LGAAFACPNRKHVPPFLRVCITTYIMNINQHLTASKEVSSFLVPLPHKAKKNQYNILEFQWICTQVFFLWPYVFTFLKFLKLKEGEVHKNICSILD